MRSSPSTCLQPLETTISKTSLHDAHSHDWRKDAYRSCRQILRNEAAKKYVLQQQNTTTTSASTVFSQPATLTLSTRVVSTLEEFVKVSAIENVQFPQQQVPDLKKTSQTSSSSLCKKPSLAQPYRTTPSLEVFLFDHLSQILNVLRNTLVHENFWGPKNDSDNGAHVEIHKKISFLFDLIKANEQCLSTLISTAQSSAWTSQHSNEVALSKLRTSLLTSESFIYVCPYARLFGELLKALWLIVYENTFHNQNQKTEPIHSCPSIVSTIVSKISSPFLTLSPLSSSSSSSSSDISVQTKRFMDEMLEAWSLKLDSWIRTLVSSIDSLDKLSFPILLHNSVIYILQVLDNLKELSHALTSPPSASSLWAYFDPVRIRAFAILQRIEKNIIIAIDHRILQVFVWKNVFGDLNQSQKEGKEMKKAKRKKSISNPFRNEFGILRNLPENADMQKIIARASEMKQAPSKELDLFDIAFPAPSPSPSPSSSSSFVLAVMDLVCMLSKQCTSLRSDEQTKKRLLVSLLVCIIQSILQFIKKSQIMFNQNGSMAMVFDMARIVHFVLNEIRGCRKWKLKMSVDSLQLHLMTSLNQFSFVFLSIFMFPDECRHLQHVHSAANSSLYASTFSKSPAATTRTSSTMNVALILKSPPTPTSPPPHIPSNKVAPSSLLKKNAVVSFSETLTTQESSRERQPTAIPAILFPDSQCGVGSMNAMSLSHEWTRLLFPNASFLAHSLSGGVCSISQWTYVHRLLPDADEWLLLASDELNGTWKKAGDPTKLKSLLSYVFMVMLEAVGSLCH